MHLAHSRSVCVLLILIAQKDGSSNDGTAINTSGNSSNQPMLNMSMQRWLEQKPKDEPFYPGAVEKK